jgi:hypothetical protein
MVALTVRKKFHEKKAKRIRWFGIDRPKKQGGTWENDIKEVGYKYQINRSWCMLVIRLNERI